MNPLSEKVLELHWYSGKKKKRNKLKSKYLPDFKEKEISNLKIQLANRIFNLALKSFFLVLICYHRLMSCPARLQPEEQADIASSSYLHDKDCWEWHYIFAGEQL